ncbi:MAG: hypothetical protein L6Q69_18220 [Zoogloea sp.]|nr:hypothetical protein [Zoogloea sp.]
MEVKKGVETTEWVAAKSGRFWSILTTVIGLVTTVGSMVVETLGHDSKAGIVAGAAIAVVGIVMKTLNNLGYIKSRTEVKVASSENATE